MIFVIGAIPLRDGFCRENPRGKKRGFVCRKALAATSPFPHRRDFLRLCTLRLVLVQGLHLHSRETCVIHIRNAAPDRRTMPIKNARPFILAVFSALTLAAVGAKMGTARGADAAVSRDALGQALRAEDLAAVREAVSRHGRDFLFHRIRAATFQHVVAALHRWPRRSFWPARQT